MAPLCLVLSDDLLDASRVIGEGRAAGLQVIQCKNQAALLIAAERRPALAILDLHNPELDVNAIIATMKSHGAKVIGYGSHVDAARLKSARQAGCDDVLPRSAFFDCLGDRLRGWTVPTPGDSG
jgi:CheY-like chemotaxis protein